MSTTIYRKLRDVGEKTAKPTLQVTRRSKLTLHQVAGKLLAFDGNYIIDVGAQFEDGQALANVEVIKEVDVTSGEVAYEIIVNE